MKAILIISILIISFSVFATEVADSLANVDDGSFWETETLQGLFSKNERSKSPFLIGGYQSNVMVRIPFVLKRTLFIPTNEKERNYWTIGFGGLNDFTISPEFTQFTFASVSLGHAFYSKDRMARVMIEADFKLATSFNYNFEHNGERLELVIIEDGKDKRIWHSSTIPFDMHIEIEKKLNKYVSTTIEFGAYINKDNYDEKRYWYYEDDYGWFQNNSDAVPIDEEPEHPGLRDFVPYAGIGISF